MKNRVFIGLLAIERTPTTTRIRKLEMELFFDDDDPKPQSPFPTDLIDRVFQEYGTGAATLGRKCPDGTNV